MNDQQDRQAGRRRDIVGEAEGWPEWRHTAIADEAGVNQIEQTVRCKPANYQPQV